MSVSFSFAEELKNVKILLAGPPYISEDLYTPFTDTQIFVSILDPGHQGITSYLEYYISTVFENVASATSDTLTYKWQYKQSGGTWTDLATGSAGPLTGGTEIYKKEAGICNTAITLPIEVRLIVSATAGRWQVKLGGSTYPVYFRAVGSIS